jgi:VIT1/CCC1 family predicted Fe2+/Mn2+ transporter
VLRRGKSGRHRLLGRGVGRGGKTKVVGMNRPKKETHFVQRMGWLRAAVLGANDGIISTASLIVGVASAAAQAEAILIPMMTNAIPGTAKSVMSSKLHPAKSRFD